MEIPQSQLQRPWCGEGVGTALQTFWLTLFCSWLELNRESRVWLVLLWPCFEPQAPRLISALPKFLPAFGSDWVLFGNYFAPTWVLFLPPFSFGFPAFLGSLILHQLMFLVRADSWHPCCLDFHRLSSIWTYSLVTSCSWPSSPAQSTVALASYSLLPVPDWTYHSSTLTCFFFFQCHHIVHWWDWNWNLLMINAFSTVPTE